MTKAQEAIGILKSKDFFKIKDEMNLLAQRPGQIIEDLFVIGTGFFISAFGLLMTAAHVLRDSVEALFQQGCRALRSRSTTSAVSSSAPEGAGRGVH